MKKLSLNPPLKPTAARFGFFILTSKFDNIFKTARCGMIVAGYAGNKLYTAINMKNRNEELFFFLFDKLKSANAKWPMHPVRCHHYHAYDFKLFHRHLENSVGRLVYDILIRAGWLVRWYYLTLITPGTYCRLKRRVYGLNTNSNGCE